jgi:2-polyprenyl-3-methyl-5-hydroxy-6-metoxy-1,4-benzoquinol methylase
MKEQIPYQKKVTSYFQSLSSQWHDVYADHTIFAETIQNRHTTVLDWVDSLALPAGARVLEIGCGAGLMATTLAERGFYVQAIDVSAAMVEQARQNAEAHGVADHLQVNVGDIYALAFEDVSFDLVLAVGVLPWIANVELALQEVARVTKPDGYVMLTTANWLGLPGLLDPQLNPLFTPLRRGLRAILERAGLRVGLPDQLPKMIYHRRQFINNALKDTGLVKMRDKTLNFGPLSFFCHNVLPNQLSLRLHRQLQHWADRNMPIVRSLGKTYLVLAYKASRATHEFHPLGPSTASSLPDKVEGTVIH